MNKEAFRTHLVSKLVEWTEHFGGCLPSKGTPEFEEFLGLVVKEALMHRVTDEDLICALNQVTADLKKFKEGMG